MPYQPLLWVVCAGRYRSGSTLQYNLIGHYVELTGQGSRRGYGACHEVHSVHTGVGVVKSHALGGWDWHVLQGCARAVVVSRPKADRERSMCRFFGIEPEVLYQTAVWREDQQNAALWDVVGTYSESYQTLTEHPVAALKKLVHHLGLRWDSKAAEQAVALANRPDTDPLSLLHENHRETS